MGCYNLKISLIENWKFNAIKNTKKYFKLIFAIRKHVLLLT